MQDPKGNRIAQWLNVIPMGGIVDLSFPLAAEAPVGEYTIKMPDRTHTFRVEEYGKSLRELTAAEKDLYLPPTSLTQSWMGHTAVNSCASCANSRDVQLPASGCNHWLSLWPTLSPLPCPVDGPKHCPTTVLWGGDCLLPPQSPGWAAGALLPGPVLVVREWMDKILWTTIWGELEQMSCLCFHWIIFLSLSHSTAQVQCLHPDASGGHHLGGELPSPRLWHVSLLIVAEGAILLVWKLHSS